MTSSTTSVYLHALGMINALGDDLDTIVRGLATGNSPGMRAIDRPGVGPAMVGQVQTPLECAPPASLARYDCRNNRLLLGALAQIGHALRTACERYGHHRVGVVLGTSTSGVQEAEAALQYKRTHQTLPQAFDYLQMEIGTLAPFAAAALGVSGPAFTISTACTSSAKAFASARRLLRLRLCDAVVVGGVDSLCEMTLQGFGSLEATCTQRTNPMSRNRAGINIGEGAAVFLMTREEGPVRLAGAGESSDAHHISAPDPTGAGAELALRAAMRDAGLDASAIGYVNLHATATRKNDEMEARLMARVFPEGVPASGTKPLTGHTLGAAGATEAGFAWLALTRDDLPLPKHRWDGEADPALPPLDLVENTRRLGAEQYAMSNSFAFGGSNASLILGRG
ncbi:beta-ketoacyl-[acyl-carrier-protein] synthase family protein [Ralstonia pseudosolanacearum]|uniref:beta-ketoacyl-[acyl-carrier-protein] synthase family protein n=1 Tax=Ralstonia pseudosolanacearum TaxID=1310165 RepID=UPI0020032EE8|nr:beta-ketoacyl-[acyl-carrier-protein] synthase family protein [Ralstonia pseudosolanacearum]MCK4152407.1 beta-ketoacyl-[acyl-carrier-protein] synthase family protein [Ralstonia pseudosolanacearum]